MPTKVAQYDFGRTNPISTNDFNPENDDHPIEFIDENGVAPACGYESGRITDREEVAPPRFAGRAHD